MFSATKYWVTLVLLQGSNDKDWITKEEIFIKKNCKKGFQITSTLSMYVNVGMNVGNM